MRIAHQGRAAVAAIVLVGMLPLMVLTFGHPKHAGGERNAPAGAFVDSAPPSAQPRRSGGSAAFYPPDTHRLRRDLIDIVAKVQAGIAQSGDAHLSERQRLWLDAFVAGLDPREVPIVVKAVDDILASDPTAAALNLQQRLLERWAEINPPEALDWANATLLGNSRERFLSAMAGAWARQDVLDAAAWALQSARKPEQAAILARIVDEAVSSDPVMALTLASALPADAGRDVLVADAAAHWAGCSPNEAVAWAAQIPDEELNEKVTSAIAVEWARRDPTSAAGVTLRSLRPGPRQNRTVIAIVERWAERDPPAAAQWVARFPEGSLRVGAEAALAEVSARRPR